MGYLSYKEKEIGYCEECHKTHAKHYFKMSTLFYYYIRLLCTDCLILWKKKHNITLNK